MKQKKKGRTAKRYSEAFKQAMVVEIESGRMTALEVRRRYGVKGAVTIAGWLRRYGRKRMKPQIRRIQKESLHSTNDERLQRENRELKTTLAQVTMEKVLLESLVTEAEEQLGVAIRKNFGSRR